MTNGYRFKGIQKDPTKPVVVVGHYPTYCDKAEALGAQCFQMAEEEAVGVSCQMLWHRNTHFLDNMMNSGGVFLSVTDPEKARSGSWFEKEVAYLRANDAEILHWDEGPSDE